MDKNVNLRLYNAMIEAAVCEHWDKIIAETDWSKDGGHVFSERHAKRINAVVRKYKARDRRVKFLRAAKRAAIVILILCAVSSAVLVVSADARNAALRITSDIITKFMKDNPGASTFGDEFQDYQTDRQMKQLEDGIAYALDQVGLRKNTSFDIHVDGWHNITISGIDEADAAKLKPYIEPMGIILSSAYASENKNQLYYVQSIIWSYEQLKGEDSLEYYETKLEYRRIIREYMFANDINDTEDIMAQTRNISFTKGKLVFEVK